MAILTLSRQLGTGGSEIARKVALEMYYSFIEKNKIISDIQKDGGPWASWSNEMDESCPTLWERFDRSFAGMVALVERSILEAALLNNVVILGRGGNFILQDMPHCLNVRIVGPLEMRIERIMKRLDISRDAASILIDKTDHDRSCYIRTVFHRDWDSPEGYDLIFDIASFSEDDIIRLIIQQLQTMDTRFTLETKEKLKKKVLAARLKAAIITDPDIFIPTLEVRYKGDNIHISGIVRKVEQVKHIKKIAQKIASGESIDYSGLHFKG